MEKITTKITAGNFFSADVQYQGIGIDIAKNFLSVCTIDNDGDIKYIAKMSRDDLIQQLAPLKPTHIVMEPCAGAAELAERLNAIGQKPILVPGSSVKAGVLAYCNGQKNDRNDSYVMARMACEGNLLHGVTPKLVKQRTVAAFLKQRQVLVDCRTKIVNSVKGRLLEAGIALTKANINGEELTQKLPGNDLLEQMVASDQMVVNVLTKEIEKINVLLENLLSALPETASVRSVPGFGTIVTAAFIATIIEPQRFKRGNSLCAYLGLVPKDRSSGGKVQLGRLSKRGNSYLRQLIVTAGMTLMKMVMAKKSKVPNCRLRDWVQNQIKKHGSIKKPYTLKAAVSCGCKLVRIALSLMKSGSIFDWMKAGVSTR